jgi:hypothetical protein
VLRSSSCSSLGTTSSCLFQTGRRLGQQTAKKPIERIPLVMGKVEPKLTASGLACSRMWIRDHWNIDGNVSAYEVRPQEAGLPPPCTLCTGGEHCCVHCFCEPSAYMRNLASSATCHAQLQGCTHHTAAVLHLQDMLAAVPGR